MLTWLLKTKSLKIGIIPKYVKNAKVYLADFVENTLDFSRVGDDVPMMSIIEELMVGDGVPLP